MGGLKGSSRERLKGGLKELKEGVKGGLTVTEEELKRGRKKRLKGGLKGGLREAAGGI